MEAASQELERIDLKPSPVTPARVRHSEEARREEGAEAVRELALYVAAGAVYITLGVFVTEILLSWVVGIGFLVLFVWAIPALASRLRR